MASLLLGRAGGRSRRHPDSGESATWITFFALGATGQMLYQLLLNTGERTVDGGTASLLIAIAPMLAALTAVVTLGERLTRLGWVGTVVAFIGAAMIAIAAGASLSGGTGILLVLAATCLWATYLVIQKTLAGRYDSLELTAWPMWIGAVLLAAVRGGPAARRGDRAVDCDSGRRVPRGVLLGCCIHDVGVRDSPPARHGRDLGAVHRAGRRLRHRHRVPARDAARFGASRRSDRDCGRGARAAHGASSFHPRRPGRCSLRPRPNAPPTTD